MKQLNLLNSGTAVGHPRTMLHELRVANPCPESWRGMEGNERVKHCSRCNLNVYNLSEMTEAEALELVQKTEGRLCVRYYQRTDGKVMTRDCKVGMAAFRMRLAREAAFAAGLTLAGFGMAFANLAKPGSQNAAAVGNFTDRAIDLGRSNPIVGPLIDKIAPQALAGDIAVPMPPAGP